MIVSAISLWKKYNLKNALNERVWGEETKGGKEYCHVSYAGHKVEDGSVRIYARFGKPAGGTAKKPAVLLLPDAGESANEDLMNYFIEKGYAVLMPDYSGKMHADGADVQRTVYPNSIAYGNYEQAQGLESEEDFSPEESTWFEWTYTALYSVKYLRSREDVGNVGVVGIRTGGEIAWQTLLSPDVKCGVPINATGWRSFLNSSKFGENLASNLSDARHRYIAAAEAQSYATYVKCPVLMLCALRDHNCDCDRAYDTYARIGNSDGNALAYSSDTGACIGPNALVDLDLFLEKNLKGREIYIPDTLNVTLKETSEGLAIDVACDKEGILEEAGIVYAEADVKTKSTYRDWHCIYKTPGRMVKNGKFTHTVKPFEGATAVFAYAYAKYINGFCVMSKITSKRLTVSNDRAVRNRVVFRGDNIDGFSVADHNAYSIANIFMESEAVPKKAVGYGGIEGVHSVGGFRTYKISSPRYLPGENALLEFDAYSKVSQELKISIEVADVGNLSDRYSCLAMVRGGGKWKRIILKAADFKGETYGRPLENFSDGSALVFSCAGEEEEYCITNILWL